mgnify:CR=1 FL=1
MVKGKIHPMPVREYQCKARQIWYPCLFSKISIILRGHIDAMPEA